MEKARAGVVFTLMGREYSVKRGQDISHLPPTAKKFLKDNGFVVTDSVPEKQLLVEEEPENALVDEKEHKIEEEQYIEEGKEDEI